MALRSVGCCPMMALMLPVKNSVMRVPLGDILGFFRLLSGLYIWMSGSQRFLVGCL